VLLWRCLLLPPGGALRGNTLAVARTIDVDADGVHCDAVEDSGGERSVAEVSAPVTERDVGGDGGREFLVSTIDQVVESVRSGRFVRALLHLAQSDIINDEQLRPGPALDAPRVGAIGQACVEVVEEVDAARVAHADALLARTQGEGFEDVALAGAGLAGDHEVIAAAHEVQAPELKHQRLVEAGLEVPIEGFERLAFEQAAAQDASLDTLLEALRSFDAKDVLEQSGRARTLTRGPREPLVEFAEGEG
jgi:hypothetical protein